MGIKNKIFKAIIPALFIHLSIGSVYCWSLFVKSISDYTGFSTTQTQFAFSLAIFFLGMSAAFGGKFVEKSIKKSSILSALFFTVGLSLTGLAIYTKSLILLYLSYGCIMGIGLGIGYLTPIKNLMLWFKDNKGLATGIAVTGFGMASAVASPLFTNLLIKYELPKVFVIIALIYLPFMIIAHLLIKRPSDYTVQTEKDDFKALSMFKNKTFVTIWIMLFLNISCGLALISVASPMMKELNLDVTVITLVIGIMGIFNGSGRLAFSAISDKMKNRSNIYKVIFGLSAIIITATLFNNKLIIISLIVISACYGAGFSCLPSLLSDKFGMNNISKIHGILLTSWSIAGICGNQVSTLVKNITDNYINVLWVLIISYMIGLMLCFKLKIKEREIK